MTNGETLIIKGTMKAIPTMKKSLATVDIKDNTPANAHFERSDVCADITTPVISIKNAYSGKISLPACEDIIVSDENAKCEIIIGDVE